MEILFVEDEPYYQFIVKKFLEDETKHEEENRKMQVTGVASMKGYKEKMSDKKYSPQLILMDIRLPQDKADVELVDDGGVQLAEACLHNKNLPIIFLSIWGRDRYQDRIDKLKDDGHKIDYLTKPLIPELMLKKIKELGGIV